MASIESSFKNMVLVLTGTSVFFAATLAFVYEKTKLPIEKVKTEARTEAFKQVLPQFNNVPANELQKVAVENDTLKVYTAKVNNQITGYAIETVSHKGFSGDIKLMVGIDTTGAIINIQVVEHKETPGLGDKIDNAKSNFSVQFKGKNPNNFMLAVKKDGGNVDAITASTISSRAYCNALAKAVKAYNIVSNKQLEN